MTPEGTVAIRPADRADLAALGRLGAELVRAHHAYDPLRFILPAEGIEEGYAWFLGSQLANDSACVMVAERDSRVVAYVYAAIEPMSWQELRDEAGYIHDLIVDPAARGAGIGARLVEAVIAWLRGRGMPRVLLQTAEPNVSAQRLFASLGFRRTMVEMTKEIA